ncbi:hypothetical protein [Actinoplanes sp. NPDC020271]|uniref:hypothetical protein n=1 Tax=Actinoplanes sp. NPDC020271 TaxID=3363896 RepID=UPI0037A22577
MTEENVHSLFATSARLRADAAELCERAAAAVSAEFRQRRSRRRSHPGPPLAGVPARVD